MAATATCGCGKVYAYREEWAGKTMACPACKGTFTMPAASVAAPADGEVWTAFERHQAKQLDHVSRQLDYLGGVALTVARRLGWAVLLLALLVGGCVQNVVVLNHR